MYRVLWCEFRVTFGCGLGAPVWVAGDLRCVFRVLWCGFRVTFGFVSGAVVQVPGDLRVRFGCSGVGCR